MKRPKAVPVVLRKGASGTEVLLFKHPLAGVQLVKGTVEPGESVNEAAVRELTEESGIDGATCERDLGIWEQCPPDQIWHFRSMHVRASVLPERWSHRTADDGGHTFEFYWHRMDGAQPENCHPVFMAALEFLRGRLATSSIAAGVA
jgi:8-oxo-dGTP pyrophosphatase MutT (NUDIX family)